LVLLVQEVLALREVGALAEWVGNGLALRDHHVPAVNLNGDVLLRVGLGVSSGDDAVESLGRRDEARVVHGDGVLLTQGTLGQEHDSSISSALNYKSGGGR